MNRTFEAAERRTDRAEIPAGTKHDSIGALLGTQVVGYAPRSKSLGGADRDPLPIELALDQAQRSWSAALAATPVAATPDGQLIQLGELVSAELKPGGQAIFRRDGRGAAMVGIVLDHMLLRAPFTATSMIGFIALAGIIVRNSILLVDFIRHSAAPDKSLPRRCWKPG